MSDVTLTGFDSEFASVFPRWFGRIVSSESWQNNINPSNYDNEEEISGWGYRYKVRVFSWHTGDKNIVPDEYLTTANVILPVTAGSGHGGYIETPSIASGSVVTGWFMDGAGGQEPYIDGVLGNSNNDVPKVQPPGATGGYQQFNDTYGSDAKVADHSRIGQNLNEVNHRIDTTHITTKSDVEQQKDKEVETPLDSTRKCKNNAEMKGIQLTIKNMVNDIERIKKDISKAQGIVGDIQSFAGTIIPYVNNAAFQASKYVKTLIGNARGWVLREIRKKINEVAPFLFPTEVSELENRMRKSLGDLSCSFSKIVSGLQQTFEGLLNDITNKFINVPMCAAENIVTKLLTEVLDLIVSGITGALAPVISFIQSATGKGVNLLGSAFNLLDIVSGIAKFFQCDEDPDCPEYDQINQAGEATPGDGLQLGLPKIELGTPLPDAGGPGPACPTAPQVCGPPEVLIFGQSGFGAVANAIISPNSNALLGFDIRNPGQNYFTPPYVSITDGCGRGRGASARANISNGSIHNITVLSPGTGYIVGPDGSLGGNGVTWKEPDEGFIIDDDGNYFVVPNAETPPSTDAEQYPVLLEIDEVEVLDPGFGYQPGDTIQVTPDNGAVLEPIIEGDQVVGVNVIKPGLGFGDFPTIEVISDNGYNAEFSPIFRPIDPETVEQVPESATIIQVIDCVGKV